MIVFLAALETIDKYNEKEYVSEIYNKYSQKVKKIIIDQFSRLNDEADDIVQLVFVDVIKYRHVFVGKSEEDVKYLLYVFTKHKCLDIIRSRNTKDKFVSKAEYVETGNFNGSKENDCADAVEQKVLIDKVKEIIEIMGGQAKDIIVLKYIYGMKHKEISDICHMTESKVRTLLSRGIAQIREKLEEEGYGDD